MQTLLKLIKMVPKEPKEHENKRFLQKQKRKVKRSQLSNIIAQLG